MVMNSRDRSLAVVGAWVVAATTGFVVLFGAATNRSFAERRTELWIELSTAEGLKKGDALLFRGVQVGEVRRLHFGRDGGVAVHSVLTRPVPLSSTARARLVAADMFGRQTVVLDDGPGGRPLASGDTLPGIPPVSLTARVEGMADRVDRLVGDTTAAAVHDILARTAVALAALESTLAATETMLAAQRGPLTHALEQAGGVAANIRVVTDSAALVALRESVGTTMRRVDGLAARLDTAASLVLRTAGRVENGDGTIGLLAGDPELYRRAVATLDSFDALLQDLRRNPKRYINVRVF
jgi:phospholipid/cholesterol/gamma-HCH transport system substrate-binding protein